MSGVELFIHRTCQSPTGLHFTRTIFPPLRSIPRFTALQRKVPCTAGSRRRLPHFVLLASFPAKSRTPAGCEIAAPSYILSFAQSSHSHPSCRSFSFSCHLHLRRKTAGPLYAIS